MKERCKKRKLSQNYSRNLANIINNSFFLNFYISIALLLGRSNKTWLSFVTLGLKEETLKKNHKVRINLKNDVYQLLHRKKNIHRSKLW